MNLLIVTKELFNDLGWLANAAGILIPTFGSILFFIKIVKPYLNKTRISSVIPNSVVWNLTKSKLMMRIAIVDDQIQDFPIAELKADGYNITTYKQIQLSKLSELANYDIIFLDMKGIVKDDPEYGGLKLIGELRKTNPYQKICAVSSKTFDPTATAFFKQADDYKKKPLTAQECRSVIDSFAEELFDFLKLHVDASRFIEEKKLKSRISVISSIKQYFNNGRNLTLLEQKLIENHLSKEQQFKLINLIRMSAHERP